jgi:hypothetical protein
VKYWLLALLTSGCMEQVCRDTYLRDMHPVEPYVLVRKCVVCRSNLPLPQLGCYAGAALPFGATLEAP